jgi:predicted nucleotidyltransferase
MTEKELEARVMEHYKEALKLYPEDRILGIFLQGSQNYYLDDEESDVDTKLLLVPTLDEIVFNLKPVSTTHILENDEHIDAKDVRLYWQCFKKGNPNFVEILFSRISYVNPMYADAWKAMIENRELVARVHPMAAAKAMMGMVQEKFHAMEHRYPSRAHIVDKFGYDPKQLQHLIRMSWFLETYVYDECCYEDILTLDYTDNGQTGFRSWLLEVKRGREYDLEKAREVAADWLARAEHALTHAKEVWSPEPTDAILCAMDNILGDIVRIAIKYEMSKEAE